jgi:hypothetical protein
MPQPTWILSFSTNGEKMKIRKATLVLLLGSGVMFLFVFLSLAHSYGMLSGTDQSLIRKMFFEKNASHLAMAGLGSLCKNGEPVAPVQNPTIATQWFELQVPHGWSYSQSERWDGNDFQRLFTLNNTSKSIDDEYPFYPFIVFAKTNNGEPENSPMIDGFEGFLSSLPELPAEHKLMGDSDIWYNRYTGTRFWDPRLPDSAGIGHETSTAMCFYITRNSGSFYGYFWGFEEDEKDFWEMISSIIWLD